ncbi:hypothetical protein EsDP_00006525 [Epichloe bromicola]|uniref:Uncharacterized protein n=1 Tax=Epichloe bromicola TaxID=79588 RepID=A0ABQ0CXX8_9HYPO
MQRIARPIATTVSHQTQLQALRLPRRTYATASKQPGPTVGALAFPLTNNGFLTGHQSSWPGRRRRRRREELMHRSKQSQFYKTFARPIAKTLVIAVFTYQFFYWGWVKLETDEHQQKTDAEIADLEAKVSVLDKARKTGEAATKVEEEPKKKSWW